jgi:hypothetical protein
VSDPDNNTTISPQAARKSGAYRSMGDHVADVQAAKTAKAAATPFRAIVDDAFVKLVGVALLYWAYKHFDVAILKGEKIYIGVCIGVALLAFGCLIPTQTRALLAWAGERIPGLRAKEPAA